MKSKKILWVVIVLGLFFLVPKDLAQATGELGSISNPLCWTESSCRSMIEKNGWKYSTDNFLPGGLDNACGTYGGYCIPAGQTDAEITIAGKIKFSDLGDYLKTIYLFALSVGGLIAVILIIMGGFAYMTSSGSSQKVDAAKTKISSAILGLLLLLGAYTLLYTINPDLVRLRLPKTYMVRPNSIENVEYCRELPKNTKVAYATSYKSSMDVPAENYKFYSDISISTSNSAYASLAQGPRCGQKFFWENSNDKTCWGHACSAPNASIPSVCVKTGENAFSCQEGNLFGSVSSPDIAFPYIDTGISLIGICNNSGKNFEIKTISVESAGGAQKYKFNVSVDQLKNLINSACGSGGAWGFYLGAEINDPEGTLGGCDDWFAIGQRNGSCNVNLGRLILPSSNNFVGDWSCGILSLKDNALHIPKENLFNYEDLANGAVCNITLTRDEFPQLNNGTVVKGCNVPDPTRCLANQ